MPTESKEFNLTQATKKQITKTVGKCEYCHKRNLDFLNVHHIKRVSDGGKSTPSNLIVLCYACHKNEAHGGSLSDTKQRKIIRNRPKKIQNAIIVILDKAKMLQKKTKSSNTIRKKRTRRQPTNQFRFTSPNPIEIQIPKPLKFNFK